MRVHEPGRSFDPDLRHVSVLEPSIHAWYLIKFRMNWEWNVGFSNYTESLRHARKLLDRGLRPATIVAYRPLLQTKAHVLLTQILANPDELDAHLYQFVVFFWRRPIF